MRVINTSGAARTFTLTIGADAAGTRLYSAASIPAAGLDIQGPFTLDALDFMQAYASGSGVNIIINGGLSATAAYATSFTQSETPLSEDGNWTHTSAAYPTGSWTYVQTSGGLALCTQDGLGTPASNIYNDSYAYLSNFAPDDHQVSEIITYTGGITGNQEIECLLRWSDTNTLAQGYECLLPRPGSSYGPQIVKWNGPYGDFTYLAEGSLPTFGDGDVWSARIVGDAITCYLNGSLIVSANINQDINGNPISKYTSGNPGIGLFRHNQGGATNPSAFCVRRFQAVSM